MSNGTTVFTNDVTTSTYLQSRSKGKRDHWFYTGMACALSAGIFAGFTRTYYARSYFHSPQIPFWVHVHGAVFTAWVLFYLLQNVLALGGRMKLHRSLGILGAVLASGVVIFGCAIALRQAREGRFFPFPDVYSSLAISFAQMFTFALFISLGLILRRHAQTHKRLILMATQLFFFPAFGRLMQGINAATLLLALCFFLAGPVYDLLQQRRVHIAYRWGVPILILTMPPFMVMASHLPPWHSFIDLLLS